MAYELDDTWEVVSREVSLISKQLVELLLKAEEKYQDITAAYVSSGNTDIAYARRLYQQPRTEKTRLKVDATAKTITHVDATGVKLTGSSLFASHQVGKDQNITNFTNAGNNIANTLLTAKIDNETIEIGEASTLVNETGTGDERVQQQADTNQVDAVGELMATIEDLHEMYGALTNQATVTADRLAQLRKLI